MLKIILQFIFCRPDKFCDAEINIEGMKVYAVERKDRDTVINYRDKDGKSWEFYLECSPEKHQDIVNRVRLKLGAENQTPVNQ